MTSRCRQQYLPWRLLQPGTSGGFNTAEGWSRDVTEDIAQELLERDASKGDLSEPAKTFVGRVLDTAT